jgi:hypothetical protein
MFQCPARLSFRAKMAFVTKAVVRKNNKERSNNEITEIFSYRFDSYIDNLKSFLPVRSNLDNNNLSPFIVSLRLNNIIG